MRAGDVIGYVGAPAPGAFKRLYFELWQRDRDRLFVPVDPRPHFATGSCVEHYDALHARATDRAEGGRVAMDDMLEAIRAAIAPDATDEARAAGATACRTILAALEGTPGQSPAARAENRRRRQSRTSSPRCAACQPISCSTSRSRSCARRCRPASMSSRSSRSTFSESPCSAEVEHGIASKPDSGNRTRARRQASAPSLAALHHRAGCGRLLRCVAVDDPPPHQSVRAARAHLRILRSRTSNAWMRGQPLATRI